MSTLRDRNNFPAGTCRNYNVIMTSKRRRFGVIMTLLLRHVPAWLRRSFELHDSLDTRS